MNSVNRLAGNDLVGDQRNLRVLVIGESEGLFASLVAEMADTAPDFELCNAMITGDIRECYAVSLAGEKVPSLSFDIILFSTDGISDDEVKHQVRLLVEEFNATHLAVTTSASESSYIDLVELGLIAAIIPASYDALQVACCLRLVCSGVHFMPIEYRKTATAEAASVYPMASEKLERMLTPRQLEVLKYVALGKSNKHIATELSLCESTVKVHVHEVMKRLGATSRTHATYIVNTQYQLDRSGLESAALAT